MNSKLIVGQLIHHHRKQKQMSQQQLAVMLNVDRQYISKIENGRINLTLDYIDKIIMSLKCTYDEFYIKL